MSASLLSIQKLNSLGQFPAYMVFSTAPYNVEDPPLEIIDPVTRNIPDNPQRYIDEITAHLKKHKEKAEILIIIHGYNTSITGVREWFKSINKHIEEYCKSRPDGLLLIGYRWPSEQTIPSKLSNSGRSNLSLINDKYKSSKNVLPVTLKVISHYGTLGLLGGGAVLLASLLASILEIPGAVSVLTITSIFTIASLVAISPIITVILLRLSGYFRDNYRANYYGIPDLVELIRQIDVGLIEGKSDAEKGKSNIDWNEHRIKLSFIGHSMGGFVVTNTVRILSDVFDSDSIGTLNAANPRKDPSRKVGNVFRLGRLVLVSPDIPAETIISGRSNFLKSSLRRFEEAYLFSNEGDMALRLASTAANYFSFPTRTQDGGYRLGNVAVRSAQIEKGKDGQERLADYGLYGLIVRLPNELLVKLQGKLGARKPNPSFGYLLGSQLAIIKDGQPVNLQGQFLNALQDGEFIRLQDGELESLQNGQIVRLENGQVVSLQTKKYKKSNDPKVWHFVEVQKEDLCRIQKHDLFSLSHGQFIKLEKSDHVCIAQVQDGEAKPLKNGQYVFGPARKLFQVWKGRLFEFKDGLLIEVDNPLPFVQADQLARFQGKKFVRLKDGKVLENLQIIEIKDQDKIAIVGRFPLDYLYIRQKKALSKRQGSIALAPNETPIGELFTFFDCTDYVERCQGELVGVVSHAKCKPALSIWNYLWLTVDYFCGKIDTHGGYFSDGERSRDKEVKPEAAFSKLAIYGLACLGFKGFLHELKNQPIFTQNEPLQELYEQILEELRKQPFSDSQRKQIAMIEILSSICQQKQIQVLLSQRRFSKDILEIGH